MNLDKREAPTQKRNRQVCSLCVVFVIGLLSGVVSLWITNSANESVFPFFDGANVFSPLVLLLNVLPVILLMGLLCFLTNRVMLSCIAGTVICGILTSIDYAKVMLRSEPLYVADITSAAAAVKIIGRYKIILSGAAVAGLLSFLALIVIAILLCRKEREVFPKRHRVIGIAACILCFCAWLLLAGNTNLYSATGSENSEFGTVITYMDHGFLYPLTYTESDRQRAQRMNHHSEVGSDSYQDESFTEKDIPPEKRVHVLGIMLEAFSDLSELESPYLASNRPLQAIYEKWHSIEAMGYSGDMISNGFAGGTAHMEWEFLTGVSAYYPFAQGDMELKNTYVKYFSENGYETHFFHPHIQSFYNRFLVNPKIGFDASKFWENGYENQLNDDNKWVCSDSVVFSDVLQHMDNHQDTPQFDFIVTLQNHGPYPGDCDRSGVAACFTPEESSLSAESCHILNNYLDMASNTIDEVSNLLNELEQRDYPVAVVLFGDHKPWMGDGNSVYNELDIDLNTSTSLGFYQYYSTPYFMWANSTAKNMLGTDFAGTGVPMSACFLMPTLFDLCGLEGPSFMQHSRIVREVTPVLNWGNVYWSNGEFTPNLPEESMRLVQAHLREERDYLLKSDP